MQGTSVVNKLYLDQDGTFWVGTKGGLFSIDAAGEADEAKEYRKFSNSIIQDIGELSTGEKVIIQKSGGVYLIENDVVKRLELDSLESDGVPRCCYGGDDGTFYLGTTGSIMLKVSAEGDVLNVIDGNGLSSFNEMYRLNDSRLWICSDTGIGILKDNSISRLDLDFGESIEEGCEDYQGNDWFVSSRQGVLLLTDTVFTRSKTTR